MTETQTTDSSTSILIEAFDLRRTFDEGRVEALRGVSFVIHEGEFVAIQGPSGSGKSTLLQMLGALDAPTGGEMHFRGSSFDLLGDMAAFRARSVGFIFQSFHLLPTLSAIENVQIPMFEMPWPAHERRHRAKELLEAVGLGDRLDHLPPKLSGGERQRVAIARSLANEPALLLADEPTGNLDSVNADKILELLEKIHTERGMTLIVVTHDPVVASHSERVLQMKDGRIVSDGRPARPNERD
ncbi:MAG TPA: ABC transporter ATP-binding protein [Candidatus Acidoferrum sp.]|nr:ABC transporter ATP-binding protein [Candidatus Acidoferrum sp.]